MTKKFSELQAGDSVWIWWLTELYEYGIQDIGPTKHYMLTSYGQVEIEPDGSLHLIMKGGGGYYLDKDCANSEAFIYGTDGWHEYKILGTSKESVRKCLEDNLNRDMEKLKANKEKWLAEFDK